VENSFAALMNLRAAWDEAALGFDAPVYMSFDWLRLWWEHYGKSSQLRVFIFSAGQRIVGLVPIYIQKVGIPVLGLRVARMVGANIPPRIFNPPVSPEWSGQIWTEVIKHLLVTDCCDLLSLGPLSERYPALRGVEQAAVLTRHSLAGQQVKRDVCTVYELPKTIEEFMESLDSKERKTRRKKLRELEEVGTVRVEVVKEPALVAEEFERFAAQHKSQWEAEGRPGHFHAWPNALEFHRKLVETHAGLGRVRFVRVLVGDEVVANQYNYAFGKTLFAELPARATGREWDRLSLGCSSQVKLLEAAMNEGFAFMDSGPGHYDYKLLLNGKEFAVVIIRIGSRRLWSRIKQRVYLLVRDIWLVLSVKLWYRRISPWLPKYFRTGQSRMALSLDF
jgi:CelD/BcsL family acetyltransferase involved in cellulose biosynthesis